MRDDGPTIAELFARGGQARRGGQGPALALAPGQARLQRGGEPQPRRRRSRRPAARCCSTSGSAAAARTTRSSSCCATRRAGAGRRVRRRHRPVPQPPRRRRPPRRPAGRRRWPSVRRAPALARRAARAARPGRRRARPDVPRALDRPDAAGPDARSPPLEDKLRHADLHARTRCRRSRPTRRRAARTPSRCCAPTRRCGPAYPFAPHGERSVARGYTKAIRRARRLIYLEDQYLWSTEVARAVRRRAARQPGPAPDRRGAAAPGRGRPVRAAAQPGRPASRRIELCRKAAPRPGARLRRGEPRGHAGLRARQGLRGRRRLVQRGQRQLQPPLLDARQRAVLRRPRRHPRRARAAPTRPGSATAPGSSPGTCGWG